MKKIDSPVFWAIGVVLALMVTAILFRPLMPIDETRYMTVAWEMRLHNGWLSPLTMNFEPYHHKPPMLFWMINVFWSILGVSRWAGIMPICLSSLGVVFLTIQLGKKIFPQEMYDAPRVALLMLGSVPFLIYSTLIMFDLTLTVFVLLSLLSLLNYAEHRKFRYVFLMGLLTGLGILTKGPVAFLYIIFPVLLAPWWVKDFKKPLSWYADCFAGLLISIFPVCLWLVPVLSQSDNNFAFWLLWEQTAGRVTGNFGDAHVRPIYFYLPLLLIMFAPWIFFPSFWSFLRKLQNNKWPQELKFLTCWVAPTFVAFSLISGKQPHYLLPLLPGCILFISMALSKVDLKKIQITVVMLLLAMIFGQAIASITVFKDYDLQPVAQYMREHPNREWAFVRNYHGEVGFLAKVEHHVADLEPDELPEWFEKNPHGMAIVRYKNPEDVGSYSELFSQSYRGKNMGIFVK